MRLACLLACLAATAACGSDVAGDDTAAVARQNAAVRDAAQAGRVLNPEAMACIRASATPEEWAVIDAEGAGAPETLAMVLNRESTARCFSINQVVVYI